MKAVALLIVAVVSVSAMGEREYQGMFTRWVAENNKAYSHEDFFHHYNTFKSNVDLIAAHNAKNATYTLAVNKFADLNTAEFGAQMCGFKRQLAASAVFPSDVPEVSVAASIDWVTKGAVTPIKDQGQCGSCWAFSSTGGIEGAVQIATGKLTSVSEQQLVDCAGSQGNQGCNGGLMDSAFKWIIDENQGGIAGESDYPYTARDGSCKKKSSVSKITGYKDVAASDDSALVAALNLGPVSVAIEADQSCFQFYHSGVLSDPSCGTNLDHGVLAVGYDTDPTGGDYYNVKNSWGTSWGDKGFIKLARGDKAGNDGQCGILLMSTYVVA
jgi:KDEL-tailed cysteine endopeptidase